VSAAPVPPLAEWLRWVAEMPAAFRSEPEGFPGGRVRVRAVVADVLETLGAPADAALLDAFTPADGSARERNRLAWAMAAAHVLWHPALREGGAGARAKARVRRLLVEELAALSAVVPADSLLAEDERREELVRRALRACGLSLPGESREEAEDRLKQVDSLERHKVLAAAAERERRSREVREAMAKKAAAEAAAKASRE